jgi:hypothetical protein
MEGLSPWSARRDDAKHRYTPDALVVCATRQMIVEVKENDVKEEKCFGERVTLAAPKILTQSVSAFVSAERAGMLVILHVWSSNLRHSTEAGGPCVDQAVTPIAWTALSRSSWVAASGLLMLGWARGT